MGDSAPPPPLLPTGLSFDLLSSPGDTFDLDESGTETRETGDSQLGDADKLTKNVERLWAEFDFPDLDEDSSLLHPDGDQYDGDASACMPSHRGEAYATEPSFAGSRRESLGSVSVNSARRRDRARRLAELATLQKPGERRHDPTQRKTPLQAIEEMKAKIFNAVRHAQAEIGVALDVVNILIAAAKPHVSSQFPLVLPPRGLATKYINRPKPSPKAQLEAALLNYSAKKKQLHNASDILSRRASSLRAVLEKEHAFWEQALELRERNWVIQAKQSPPNGKDPSFYINYGFSEVGSTFKEPSFAEIRRDVKLSSNTDQDNVLPPGVNSKAVVLTIPHSVRMSLRLMLHKRRCGASESSAEEWMLWDLHTDEEFNATIDRGLPDVAEMHQRLLAAQSTIFEMELYHQLVAEVASNRQLPMRMREVYVSIPIDDELDLLAEWGPLQERQLPSRQAADIQPIRVELADLQATKVALQAKIRRRHRRNFERLSGSAGRVVAPDRLLYDTIVFPIRYRRWCDRVLSATERVTLPAARRGLPVSVHLVPLAGGFQMAGGEENWDCAAHVLVVGVRSRTMRFHLRPPDHLEARVREGIYRTITIREMATLLTEEFGRCGQ